MMARVAARVRRAAMGEEGRSVAARMRAKRWAEILRRFPDLGQWRVIDLGGAMWAWDAVPVTPAALTVVNLDDYGLENSRAGVKTIRADACDLPAVVFEEPFDLVYSNSVIEHLGGYWRRRAFADAVRRLAPRHWIQTPSRSFPLEPHWMFPGMQFLPLPARASISARWPLAHESFRGRTRQQAVDDVLRVELVGATEMRSLFPESELYRERVAGITKSLVAIRQR